MNADTRGPEAAIVTGDAYDAQLARRSSDRIARAAFRQLVAALAPPGASVLDFGAGTGLDAVWYAQHGFKVRAFEPDPRMCAAFATRCRPWLDCGVVTLEEGGYEEFLARSAGAGAADVITANFAPLNLVPELPRLFAHLHVRCARGGRVLASVLNPWYPGDLRYGWWWRKLLPLVLSGRFAVPGASGPILRRNLAAYGRDCQPYFALRGAFPGRAFRKSGGLPQPPPFALACFATRYLFLLFEWQDPAASHADSGLT